MNEKDRKKDRNLNPAYITGRFFEGGTRITLKPE